MHAFRRLPPETATQLSALAGRLAELAANRKIDWSDAWPDEDLNEFRAASLLRHDAEESKEPDWSLAPGRGHCERCVSCRASGAVVGILTTKLPRTRGATDYVLQDWQFAGIARHVQVIGHLGGRGRGGRVGIE